MTYQPLPLGTSDFQKLIESNLYYIDKTPLIADIIRGAEITLLPRPRRFGKTLNMSMLQYFFDNSADYRHLFNDLVIEQNSDAMKHCGQYPVIFLSFKDVEEQSLEGAFKSISALIKKLYAQHSYLMQSPHLHDFELHYFNQIINSVANRIELTVAIKRLSEYLHRHHQKSVVIIVDAYDIPINNASIHGYYDDLVGFMINLLDSALKDNPCLFKGVLSGVLHTPQQSIILAGLNNLYACPLSSAQYAQYFGFTETETKQLLNDYELTHLLDEVDSWYSGYQFGSLRIYNPWSILHWVQNKGELRPYWPNTADYPLIRDLIAQAPFSVKQELEALLNDKNAILRKPLNENVVFRDIQQSNDALWNFLLFSGYLAYKNKALEGKRIYADLVIPNMEVASFYEEAILAWFEEQPNNDFPLSDILSLLLKGDFDSFSHAFRRFCADTFSYFDVQGKQPERFYHAFVLGMLVQLQATHSIKSNRESGYGRYDVCLIPHDKSQAGFVFEFKSVDEYDNLTLEQACEVALKQIADKQYVAELHALGIQTVYPVAMAFEGKRVLVRFGEV